MRPLCIILPEAQDDIDALTEYIARDNFAAALRFHEAVHQTNIDLADQPGMGIKVQSAL